MDAPLPELHSGDLDPATLEQLLTELFSLTTIWELRIKAVAQRRSQGSTSEADLRAALSAGQAAQILYVYDGKLWMDTLMPTPTGVRLVRIERSAVQT